MNTTPQGVGRPRSMASCRAILETALQLTLQDGFASLTIERISKQARVGKPTIYRWWPSKGAIVLDALMQYGGQTLPLPEASPLPARLEIYLQMLFKMLNGEIGTILKSLMGEAQHDPEFAMLFRNRFIAARRQPVLTLLRDGIERGELPPDSNIEVLADLIYGAMWYRLLVQHGPLDEQFAHDIVHVVL
jgi:AcrR family transcriptional regulator